MKKEELKIVFFGTPEFAVESLQSLIDGGYNVAAVVTVPDKPAGRGQHIIESDVKKCAIANNIPVLQPEKLKSDDFIEALRNLNADLFIVIAFRMLPEIVWSMPRLGTFNLHASLLPKYRGAAPINWAIINGEKETGVTTFFLQHEIDTGDIIQQKKTAIAPDENVEAVYNRLMKLGAQSVLETVGSILDGTVATIPQTKLMNENVEPTPAPKIFKDTCIVNWNDTALHIHDFIRGLSPYPAAWNSFRKNGKDYSIKFFGSNISDKHSNGIAPGTVISDKKHLYIACRDLLLEITSVQISGKRRMSAEEFLRGFDMADVSIL